MPRALAFMVMLCRFYQALFDEKEEECLENGGEGRVSRAERGM